MAKKTSPSVSDMSAPVVTGKAGLSNGLKIALFVSLIIAFTLGYIAISLTIQDDVDLVWRIVTVQKKFWFQFQDLTMSI